MLRLMPHPTLYKKTAVFKMIRKLTILFFVIFFSTASFARTEEHTNVMQLEIKPGETLSDALAYADISEEHAKKAINELKKVYDMSNLQVGQKVRVVVAQPKKLGDDFALNSLQIKLSNNKRMEVLRLSGDNFIAQEIIPPTMTKLIKATGEVNDTLFSPTLTEKIPAEIRETFIKNYSYDVDLQREIQSGDSFSILFEQLYDQDGAPTGTGDIIYSSLTLSGATHDIYYYTMPDGQGDYYDEKGAAVKKSLLRTPIDGARITSAFGVRTHPFLGYSKQHQGLDFGAPSGTPIYSAGNGIIVEMGTKGNYGKYIRVNHDDKYATAYAHMSKFAKGLKAGSKVSQGQIIGYVGTTGRSTGPHLHYEVLASGKHINPLSIKTFASYKLGNTQMALFKKYKQTVYELTKGFGSPDKMANR
jgi:murein DD-endopeptidase MepM/ murein hydrolase activator NlpD